MVVAWWTVIFPQASLILLKFALVVFGLITDIKK